MRALALIALLLLGCNHHDRDQAWGPRLVVRNCDVYLPLGLTGAERRDAVSTITYVQAEWTRLLRQQPSGQLLQVRLYVYREGVTARPAARLSGEPWGWAERGQVHLSLGSCAELPGLGHGLAHIWLDAPLPHDPAWVATDLTGAPIRVAGRQVDWAWLDAWQRSLEATLRAQRGCP